MREAIEGWADGLKCRAVRAWRELQSVDGEPDRVEVLKGRPSSRRLVCRLVGADGAGSAVIGKRCRRSAGLTEHTIYEHVLPHLPMASLRCYGLVEEADSDYSWLFLEDAGEVLPHLHADHLELAAHWLGLLHTCATQVDSARGLPRKEPSSCLKRLQSVRDTIRDFAKPGLRGEDSMVLEAMVSNCDQLTSLWDRIVTWCEGVPSTLMHGDFVQKNLRIRMGRLEDVLLVFDWGEAGWGVPAADLPDMDVATYWSVVRHPWPWLSLRSIQRLTTVGKTFRCVDAIHWELSGFHHRVHVDRMKHLTIYASRLADAVHAVRSAV
jgi:hypothetical protein